ncbi:MAG: helix-turn-helix domain-containing protein [Cypionkella sp.]|nr:helix-turn-helix domain-containing protein [Cypionkella sp.]
MATAALPDVLHIETIPARAAGLDWHIAPHRHLHLHQFFLMTSGAAQVRLDGDTPQITPPFLLNVPAGVVHGFTFSAGTQGWVLTVPLQTLPDVLGPAQMAETSLGRAGFAPVCDEIIYIFQNIASEHGALRLARATMLRALATALACMVMRKMDGAAPAKPTQLDPRFVAFQSLLAQHLRSPWRLEDYARALGVSPRHLSRICHAATGQPAAAVIEAATIREACRLLAYTRATVASVGYSLGYDDPSYFSRAFRRVTGRAPSTYRAAFDQG